MILSPSQLCLMLVVWGCSSKGGFNFILEMIFVQVQESLNLYGLRLIGPKLWHELDERFKCRTFNQFKKELTSISLVSINLYWYFDGLYLFTFCFVLFCIFTFVPSYDNYVYQCICCASFLTFTVLIIIITVTQLV